MARCAKLVGVDGKVTSFTPQASFHCARGEDWIIGSSGLDVGFIFYTSAESDNVHPVASCYGLCSYVPAKFFSLRYFKFSAQY